MAGTLFPSQVRVLPYGKFLTEISERSLFGIQDVGPHAWSQFFRACGGLYSQTLGPGWAPRALGTHPAGACGLHSQLPRVLRQSGSLL